MDDDLLITDNHFSTDDLALAAALAMVYPVAAVDRDNPHGMQFVFQRYGSMGDVIEQYRSGELSVEPRAYAERLHRLQAMGNGD